MTSERMSDAEIAAVRERAAAATPGPWKFTGDRGDPFRRVVPDHDKHSFTGVRFSHDDDARFVAAARTDIPRLCDELEEARSVLRAILEPDDELDFGVPSDVTLDWQRIQLLVCAYLRATDAARSTEGE